MLKVCTLFTISFHLMMAKTWRHESWKGKIEVDDSEKQPRLTIFFLSCYPKGSFLEAIGGQQRQN